MSTPRGKADGSEAKTEPIPIAEEESSKKKGISDSERSKQASHKNASKPASHGVPMLGQLRSLVDSPSSHEFLWPTPRGQSGQHQPSPRSSDVEKGKIDEQLKVESLLFDLAAALLQAGAPVHKTEKTVDDVSQAFHVESTFTVFPGVVLATFGKLPRTHTISKRVTAGLNCARLALLDDLAASIKAKETGLEDAMERLKYIQETRPFFPEWVKIVCISLSSALIAPMFFGGGWRDLLVSGLFGLLVGLLGLAAAKFTALSRLYEPISALLVSFFARLASAYIPGLCLTAINFAAICWLLPGLSVTTAMIEMATRHIISGTTRMFFAFLIAIELGFGIAIGQKIPLWDDARGDECTPLDVRYNALFFPVTVMCWNLLLDANPWQWIGMSVCAAVGYVVSWAMGTVGKASPDVSAATAAFAVAVMGNFWGRITGHAAIVPILGGILILVPGSLGVRGVLGFLSNKTDAGVDFAVQMIIVALSIAVGVFVGQLVEIPKGCCNKKLKSVNVAL